MTYCFLTSGHDPFDDRIFYHMAAALAEDNHSVIIISSTAELREKRGLITLNCFNGVLLLKKDKIDRFIDLLWECQPDVIICSEPLTVYAAGLFRKREKRRIKVIYDITEWYPSGKNLRSYNHCLKWFHFIRLFIFGIVASFYADKFIFGEYYKSLPYKFLFFYKPNVYISYYPEINYIPETKPSLKSSKIILSYSGKINREKGYLNFMNVVGALAQSRPSLEILVRITGWRDPDSKEKMPETVSQKNVTIEHTGRLSFTDYLKKIEDTDIFLDLRSITLENNHCLPIKLFLYAAFGKPVIFSDLKAIKKEIDISQFGFSVNPESTEKISKLIGNYIDNTDLYNDHCMKARKMIASKYNWGIIKNRFIGFVT